MIQPAHPTQRHPRVLLAVLSLAVLAASLWAILARSPWYDEYYTFFVTRPALPSAPQWPAWLRDNHPPLFYLLAWATGWLGDTVPPRRLINLVFAACAAFALWRIARAQPALRPTLFVYAVALPAMPPVILHMAELRSNFLAFAAGSVAVAALAAFAAPGEPIRRRAAVPVLAASLGAAFSVHLAATIILAAFSAAFALRLALARDWAGTRRLALAGILAAAPFAAAMTLQLGTIAGNTRTFWIPGGFSVARWTIEMEVIAGLSANLPLTAAGLAGLALLCWRDARSRRLSAPLSLALTLGSGLALASVLLVAIHLQRPFVITRYLVCLHPALAMILAIGAAEAAQRLRPRWRLALHLALLAGTVVSLGGQLRRAAGQPGWDTTARFVAAQKRACPGTVVHAATAWNAAVLALSPAENRVVLPAAYRFVAARHGFAVEPEGSRRMARGCPTLFWAEHGPAGPATAQAIAARLGAIGYPLRGGTLHRLGDGWVFAAR